MRADINLKKHKNDVLRLFQVIDPTVNPAAPDTIKAHMREFIARMASEDLDLKSLGIRTETRETVLAALAAIYRLG